ncbi:multidrug ABC transporter substrate-binding protein [Candidatus Falkowbacteria bacterium CG10_big_fil_rev_8_21_14_0_10_43_10]|uniref:Multidrug ABC transporter substrate-binding protein n=1 Tax=Candidatus Falkowbacteria bacterium CG10_big_fil_rev_8_21_14_0_10_43_10 TaxID=1974567 RepID=A0A2H0V329_9BACT|nr:MAG: multidrug ABC transporter substrate-binding protein [Candidatus Falkowbacteria bacterium CG10_big_fil_rev_8_21_14_0_10_43_10]
MLFTDLLQETYFALSANKSRSVLTILGIVIGIASVITMISIGQGAAKNIESNIESLGSNLLVVMPGSQKGVGTSVRGGMGSATTLTLEDAEAIDNQIEYAAEVAPAVSSRKQVKTTRGTNTNTSIYGVDESYGRVKNIEMEQGSFINNIQAQKASKVAVIGPTARDDLFGEGSNPVGQKIRIESLEFTIAGVTASKGGTGFGSSDDLIYIPISTAQRYLTGSNSVSNINIQISAADLMTPAQEQITSLLLTRHKITDSLQADFSIMNQADILSTATSITDTLTLLLAAIAGISLLVGGIGIMNMMLTTVTERTREIGLRKALGAKNGDISRQFLGESVALTFIGGIIGIIIGWLAAWAVTKFSGTTTSVTSFSVLLAFGVSAAIGIIFGYYPARRASLLNPIEALRYE